MRFEFYLADKKHCTVAELRSRMTNQEFGAWLVYYATLAQEEKQRQLEVKAGMD